MADALKAEGNALFSAGKYSESIEKFTQAIEVDPTNHILYSNRSGAYTALKDYDSAIDDANKVIELNPSWAKGWNRKGAAYHGKRDYQAAHDAYSESLRLDPSNKSIQSLIDGIERNMSAEAPPGSPFSDPKLLEKLASHPQTKEFMADPTFVARMVRLQNNPTNIGAEMQDPRVVTALGALMGVDISMGTRPSEEDPSASARSPPQPPKKKEPEPEPEPEPENEEEIKKKADKAAADKEKELGTQFYKKRQFDEAIEHYSKAWEIHQDVSYLTNLGAAYLEKGDYDNAISTCEKAIEEGRKVFADFKLIARAYARIGTAYEKKGDLASAIKQYNSALTEHRTPDTLAKLRAAENAKIKMERESYIDPEKADEARESGNALFKEAKWAEAVQAYTEMIKRAPQDPRGYSNRAACFIKLLQFPSAVDDCDLAISRDETFVRAYLRKAQALFGMRQYNVVLDVCEAAEPHATDARTKSEIEKQRDDAMQAQFAARAGETEEQTMERIQKDPEILSILQDPVMRTILGQAKSNPAALQEHLQNPQVRSKVQKLIAAGVIRLG